MLVLPAACRTIIASASAALLLTCVPLLAFAQSTSTAAPPEAPVDPPHQEPAQSAQPVQSAQPAQPAQARAAIQAWGFDPAVLVADGRQLLLRAPDPAVDGVFQALLATSRTPQQARVLCGLFEPQADRSLAGLNAVAAQFDEATRQRYANAVALLFVAAAQNPPQPFDAAAARHLLRQAGVRASILHDGFMRGLNGDDTDARCHAIGLLLQTLAERPLAERAAVTRLLLIEGLDYVATGSQL